MGEEKDDRLFLVNITLIYFIVPRLLTFCGVTPEAEKAVIQIQAEEGAAILDQTLLPRFLTKTSWRCSLGLMSVNPTGMKSVTMERWAGIMTEVLIAILATAWSSPHWIVLPKRPSNAFTTSEQKIETEGPHASLSLEIFDFFLHLHYSQKQKFWCVNVEISLLIVITKWQEAD